MCLNEDAVAVLCGFLSHTTESLGCDLVNLLFDLISKRYSLRPPSFLFVAQPVADRLSRHVAPAFEMTTPIEDAGSPSAENGNSGWSEPPWSGWIETTGDALLILEAARRGLIPRVTRRLVDSERKMITSGSVFVFDEDESGIKRWTDGFVWSPSRILGNFLVGALCY